MSKADNKGSTPKSEVAFESPLMKEEEIEQFRDVSWDLRKLLDESGEETELFYEDEPLPSEQLVDAGTEYFDKYIGSADEDEDDPEDHIPQTDAVDPETAVALIAENDPDEREILRLSGLGSESSDRLGGLFMGMTKKEIAGEHIILLSNVDAAGERLLQMIKDGEFPETLGSED